MSGTRYQVPGTVVPGTCIGATKEGMIATLRRVTSIVLGDDVQINYFITYSLLFSISM